MRLVIEDGRLFHVPRFTARFVKSRQGKWSHANTKVSYIQLQAQHAPLTPSPDAIWNVSVLKLRERQKTAFGL